MNRENAGGPAPNEESLLKDTWIGHYQVLPTPD
jgi:hypothetical protein